MNYNDLTSIELQLLKYQPTLACDLFETINTQPWAMLLRSASQQHVDSRYDILVHSPIATLETIGDTTYIKNGKQTIESKQDPFTLLAQYQNELLPQLNAHTDIPFIGGALGFFSYDLGRRVEKVADLAIKDITSADMALGLYEWALIVDHHLQTAYVVGINAQLHAKNLTALLSKANKHNTDCDFSLTSSWQSNMTKQDYSQKFATIQEYLHSGDCYQINLAQRFTAQYNGSEWQAYLRLEQNNSAPFSAFIRTERSAILSVSPERFLQLNQNKIQTKPIKGTRPRSSDPVQDEMNANELVNAEKDQAENLMIVDLLRNDIGRVAQPGSVRVPKLFDIESFPAVHHLVSTVTGQLDDQYSTTDLLRACFPGGSITGAPKVRAMQIIEELEPHRRSAYCGSIGYISRNGNMDTNITIRTLVAENNQLFAWAGGGIVADSLCEAEYQETLDKLSRILPVLSEPK